MKEDGRTTPPETKIATSETKEQIIKKIIDQAEVKRHEHKDGTDIEYTLSYGNKKLRVNISSVLLPIEQAHISTFINTIAGQPSRQQTRHLYQAAREIMQKHANELNQALIYRVETGYKKMKKFMDTHGQEIFGQWKETKTAVKTEDDLELDQQRDPDEIFPDVKYQYFQVFDPEKQQKEER